MEAPNFGYLATVMADGSPQVSPVWVDLEGDLLVINTATGRVKEKNMRREPRVAISIADKDNQYEKVDIRGRVAEFVEGDEAFAHIDKMAQKYMGQETVPVAPARRGARAGEDRARVDLGDGLTIAPLRELEGSLAGERSDEDLPTALVVLASIAGREVLLTEDEVHGAARRAILLLAAGGDPERGLDLNGRAVGSLADELRTSDRQLALERGNREPPGGGFPSRPPARRGGREGAARHA